MENPKSYVTHLELERSQNKIKTDLKKEITIVDDKVDGLKELVLPLVQTSQQTAENTKQIADTMRSFTDEQRQTNGKFHDKLHTHDVKFALIDGNFEAVGMRIDAAKDNKTNNAKVITGVISAVAVIIAAIFAAAPYVFGQ